MLPPSKNTCSKNADCTIENTASYCSKYGCRCRYNCHRFGFSEENSICAYPSNGDALIDLQIFGNACELNYYQCITKQDFLIACTGSSCSDDWCSSAVIDDGFQKRICKNNDVSKRCSNNGICLERTIDSRHCKCPNGYTGALCDTKIDYRLPSTTVQKCEVSDRDFYSSCRPCYITNIATVAIFATVFGIILLRRPQKHQNTLNRRVSLSKCTSERSLIGNERDETLASLIDFSRERNRIGRIRSISGGSAGPFSRSNRTTG